MRSFFALAAAWACAYMSLGCASVTAPTATPGSGGSSAGTAGTIGGGGSIGLGGFGGSGQIGTCVNLQCQQDNCMGGACKQIKIAQVQRILGKHSVVDAENR